MQLKLENLDEIYILTSIVYQECSLSPVLRLSP